jgi:hypothetical protein
MKEVTIAPTSATSSMKSVTSAAATGPLNYQIPGQFFVANSKKWTYKFNMYFGSQRTFRQVFTDFDVYHGGWDPKKPGGVHLVAWTQFKGWATMMKYLNATTKMTKYRWVYKPKGSVGGSTPIMKPGNTYHAHIYWDGVLHRNGFRLTKGGLFYDEDFALLGASSFTYGSLFIVFGHGKNGPDGPESRSPNWKWSNLDIDLIP